MAARGSRKSSDVDGETARLRIRRSSGRRLGRVLVGHDKEGRSKHRLEGTGPGSREAVSVASGNDEWEARRERYPNLAARRELERAQHARRAMAMGVPRGQANAHAWSEIQDGRREQAKRQPRRR